MNVPAKRILLIEDNEDDYLIVRDLLGEITSQSFVLEWVEAVEAARGALSTGQYDVCLVDHRLLGRSGLSLIEEQILGDPPFILMTGQEDHQVDLAATKAGAMDYLLKGQLTAPLLERSIRYAIERARREAALAQREATLEASLRQSRLLSTAVNHLTDGMIVTDARQENHPIVFANPAFCAITGYDLDEILGRNCRFLQGDETDPQTVKQMWQALENGQPFEGVIRNYRKNGTLFWNEVKITPVFDESGQLVSFVGFQADITARRQAEIALQESQADMAQMRRKFESILNSIGEGLHVFDTQGRISFENPASVEMLGWNLQQLIGRPAHQTIHHTKPDGTAYPQSECPIHATLRDGVARRVDSDVFWRQDGTSFPVEFLSTRLDNPQGEIEGVVLSFRDITQRKQVEAQLRFQKTLLEAQSEASPDGILAISTEGKLLFYNRRYVDMWNIPPDVVASADNARFRKIVLDQIVDSEQVLASALEVYKQSDASSHDEMLLLDGRIFDRHSAPILNPDGSCYGRVWYFRDISGAKQTEQALRAGEERFQSMVSNVPGMVYQFVLHASGATEVRFVSEGSRELLELKPGEIHTDTASLFQLIRPEDRDSFGNSMALSASRLTPWAWEGQFKTRSGKTKWVQGAARPQTVPGGGTLWNALLMDITDRKLAEEERDRFFTLSLDMLGIAGVDGYFKRLNPAFSQILGYSEAELLSKPFLELVHPQDQDATLAVMERLSQGNLVVGFENRYRNKDGSYRWIEWKAVAVPEEGVVYAAARDVTGRKEAEAALLHANDELEARVLERTAQLSFTNQQLQGEMTERQRAEEALSTNHDFLQAILENTAEAIVACDANGQLTFFNRATREFHGLPLEPLPVDEWAQHYSLFLPDGVTPMQKEDVPLFKALRGEHIRDVEMVIAPKEGGARLVLSNGEPFFDAKGTKLGAVVVMHDISERKQAEQHLAVFAAIVDSSHDAIISKTLEGVITSWNRGAEILLGYPASEAIGQSVLMLIPPERADEESRILARQTAGERINHLETVRIRKDGQPIDVSLTLSPIRDSQGKTIGLSKIARDITQRKQAETELQHAKEEADLANAAKSEFLSRMSHELRTPLNAILGFGQILDLQKLTPLQSESVGHILKGGSHLLSLVNDILDISRVEAGYSEFSIEPVSIADLVAECCALVRPLADESGIQLFASLQNEPRDDGQNRAPHHVMADRQRLKQVLLNLLSNAIKYNRPQGQVKISLDAPESGRLRLRVSDSGLGLSPEDVKKLFTPFERLHAASSIIEGTGLGLVISQRLVVAMGGILGVESAVGQGSTFWIELPLADSPIEALSASVLLPPALPRAGHTCTVLSIEDNLSNVRLMEAILASRPHTTLINAMQGSLGLDLARQHQPDVILLDLHLPGLSGSEVWEQLQLSEKTKSIPVIVISADATAKRIEQLLTAGVSAYLTKPLDVAAFLDTLEEVLQGNRVDKTRA